jgi:hypothetical protein
LQIEKAKTRSKIEFLRESPSFEFSNTCSSTLAHCAKRGRIKFAGEQLL